MKHLGVATKRRSRHQGSVPVAQAVKKRRHCAQSGCSVKAEGRGATGCYI